MNLYEDMVCPECKGRIVTTARMMDDTQAPTHCENKHTFMRSEAVAKVQANGDMLDSLQTANDDGFNVGAKIRASQRLLARSKIQADVTRVAEQGIKDIMRMMDLKGYHSHMEKRRALYELQFVKDEEEFSLCGWHGTGMYGKDKSILELYEGHDAAKPVINVPSTDLDESQQKAVIQKIVIYLTEHA